MSYTSIERHNASTIAAICRAIVSFARLGFAPPSRRLT
jgi:hypothetical protein